MRRWGKPTSRHVADGGLRSVQRCKALPQIAPAAGASGRISHGCGILQRPGDQAVLRPAQCEEHGGEAVGQPAQSRPVLRLRCGVTRLHISGKLLETCRTVGGEELCVTTKMGCDGQCLGSVRGWGWFGSRVGG